MNVAEFHISQQILPFRNVKVIYLTCGDKLDVQIRYRRTSLDQV